MLRVQRSSAPVAWSCFVFCSGALAASVLFATFAPSLASGDQKRGYLPWTLRVDVHWGGKRNRESYREGLSRYLLERLAERSCFQKVVDTGPADLIFEVRLNDFITEQEYATVAGLIPGQGEEHQLVAARASVDLDYWLSPEGRTDVEFATGHIFREITREYDGPGDATEQRAIKELFKDASGWLIRNLCDQRDKLGKKIEQGLAAPRPAPAAPDPKPAP